MRRLSLLVVLGLVAAMALMPSAAAGGGCYPDLDNEMTSSSETLVGIGECAFRDTVVYIEPGEEVTWVNKDPVPHTVSGAAYSWGTERMLDQRDRVSYTFEKDGVYPYYCLLHPTMVGAVVVGDATPAALTNGMADVSESKDAGAAGTVETEPTAGTASPGTSAAIGLAIALTLAFVAVAARIFLHRRRTAATP